MSNENDTNGAGVGWTEFAKQPLMVLGGLGFIALLFATVVMGQSVNVGWLTLIAGMFGLNGVIGLLRS